MEPIFGHVAFSATFCPVRHSSTCFCGYLLMAHSMARFNSSMFLGVFAPPAPPKCSLVWCLSNINTRTGEVSENHTVWRGGGAYNFRSISAPMRAAATNFGGYLGPHYNFLTKILGPWVNPFKVKKGQISKMLIILTEKNSLPVFPC